MQAAYHQNVYVCDGCTYIEKLEFHGVPVQLPFVMDFASRNIKKSYVPIPYQAPVDLLFALPQSSAGYAEGDVLADFGRAKMFLGW